MDANKLNDTAQLREALLRTWDDLTDRRITQKQAHAIAREAKRMLKGAKDRIARQARAAGGKVRT